MYNGQLISLKHEISQAQKSHKSCIKNTLMLHKQKTQRTALQCWLVEQGLTSHSTQFRSFGRRCFDRSNDPTDSVKALKEGG